MFLDMSRFSGLIGHALDRQFQRLLQLGANPEELSCAMWSETPQRTFVCFRGLPVAMVEWIVEKREIRIVRHRLTFQSCAGFLFGNNCVQVFIEEPRRDSYR